MRTPHSVGVAGSGGLGYIKHYLHAGRGGKPARRYSQNYLRAGRGVKPARRSAEAAGTRIQVGHRDGFNRGFRRMTARRMGSPLELDFNGDVRTLLDDHGVLERLGWRLRNDLMSCCPGCSLLD